jgi:hypothetical protein
MKTVLLLDRYDKLQLITPVDVIQLTTKGIKAAITSIKMLDQRSWTSIQIANTMPPAPFCADKIYLRNMIHSSSAFCGEKVKDCLG